METHSEANAIEASTRKRWIRELECDEETGQFPLEKGRETVYHGYLIDLGATVAAIQSECMPAILDAIQQTIQPEIQNLTQEVSRLRNQLRKQQT